MGSCEQGHVEQAGMPPGLSKLEQMKIEKLTAELVCEFWISHLAVDGDAEDLKSHLRDACV